jgi:DNA (cytosine-5)-methyltransferase 1
VKYGLSRPIAVDLFAGAGGMSLGFEQAGFDVLAAVEIDPIHACTHEFNFPFCTVLCKSVAETTGKEIRTKSIIGDRDIDVVFGGPPCQGFSLIGKRHLDDPRNSLVFHFLRLVLELKPKYFVMENVPGITIGKHQKLLEEIINNFKKIGYKVEENYQILNAANYGVPQKRRRLFLLGCRSEYQLLKYPEKLTNYNSHQPPPTVWDAIGNLPEVNNYPELRLRDWVEVEYGKPSYYAIQLRRIVEEGLSEASANKFAHSVDLDGDYSYPRKFNFKIITCSSRTRHSSLSMQRFTETPPGKTEPISRFYKLDPNGLCNTLRAGTASNRGAFTSPRPIHPYTPRCITVREAARLHSYSDWFRFHATKWHGFRQIGNSVPPLLAKAVAREILCALELEPIKPLVEYQLGDKKFLQFKMVRAAEYYGVDRNTIEPRNRQKKGVGTSIRSHKS